MKVHVNAMKVMVWLSNHQRATVGQIAAKTSIKSRDVSVAVQYSVRHGSIERVPTAVEEPKTRPLYRVTGKPLPTQETGSARSSFDELLTAWGIARVPPQLNAETSYICDSAD
jgi:hypothetical protein